jgi:hypothetical protein
LRVIDEGKESIRWIHTKKHKTLSIFFCMGQDILTCMAIRLLKVRNASATFVVNKTASLEYLELSSGNPLVKLLDLLSSQQ